MARPGFNTVLLIGVLLRGVFFFMEPFVWNDDVDLSHWHNVFFVLNTLPTILFFTCYLVLLFLWIVIFHSKLAPAATRQGVEISTGGFRNAFILINACMYSFMFALFGVDYFETTRNPSSANGILTPSEEIVVLGCAVIYVGLAVSFVVYGLLFWITLRRLRLSALRRAIMQKVGRLTALVAICFTTRTIMIIVAAVSTLLDEWYLDVVYYGILELIPLGLTLLILQTHIGVRSPSGHAGTFAADQSVTGSPRKSTNYGSSDATDRRRPSSQLASPPPPTNWIE
jgi:hypothetical protein